MVSSKVFEIEIDDDCNRNLLFGPIGFDRKIRGRFDLSRVKEPMAAMRAAEVPQPIPGQRLGVDVSNGTAYIVEPLHDAEHAATRERIEKSGQRIAEARETFDAADVPTWLYHMRAAVQGGHARIVSGELPDKIEGKVQLSFVTQPALDPIEEKLDKLVDLQKQVAALEYAKLTPEQRKAYNEFLALE